MIQPLSERAETLLRGSDRYWIFVEIKELEAENERLCPLAEAYVRELEIQYERTDDSAHYQAWQTAKKALGGKR